jgi:hypothetical protein
MSPYGVWKQQHGYTFHEPTKTRIERGQNCIAFYFRFLQDYAQIMQTRTHIPKKKVLSEHVVHEERLSEHTCSPRRKLL